MRTQSSIRWSTPVTAVMQDKGFAENGGDHHGSYCLNLWGDNNSLEY